MEQAGTSVERSNIRLVVAKREAEGFVDSATVLAVLFEAPGHTRAYSATVYVVSALPSHPPFHSTKRFVRIPTGTILREAAFQDGREEVADRSSSDVQTAIPRRVRECQRTGIVPEGQAMHDPRSSFASRAASVRLGPVPYRGRSRLKTWGQNRRTPEVDLTKRLLQKDDSSSQLIEYCIPEDEGNRLAHDWIDSEAYWIHPPDAVHIEPR